MQDVLGVVARWVRPPEHGQVALIDHLAAATKQIITQRLARMPAQLGLQCLGKGLPNTGHVQFCHRADTRSMCQQLAGRHTKEGRQGSLPRGIWTFREEIMMFAGGGQGEGGRVTR